MRCVRNIQVHIGGIMNMESELIADIFLHSNFGKRRVRHI